MGPQCSSKRNFFLPLSFFGIATTEEEGIFLSLSTSSQPIKLFSLSLYLSDCVSYSSHLRSIPFLASLMTETTLLNVRERYKLLKHHQHSGMRETGKGGSSRKQTPPFSNSGVFADARCSFIFPFFLVPGRKIFLIFFLLSLPFPSPPSIPLVMQIDLTLGGPVGLRP